MEPTDASHAALSWLWGARIQRVDGPRPGCLSLTLYDRGDKQFLVLLFGNDGRGVGALRDRPTGQAASSFVQRLRGELEGARLTSARWLTSDSKLGDGAAIDAGAEARASALLLTCQHGQRCARVVVDFDAKTPNLFLLRDDGTIAIAADERLRRERHPDRKQPYAPGSGRGIARIESAEALFEAGQTLWGASARQADEAARKQAQAHARAALKRVERKADAIRGDLARADSAPLLRREAQLLLSHLGEIPRGASTVRLLDQSVDPPTYLTITLDPAKDARVLAQQRFDRARRLQRGVAIASRRLAETERELSELQTLLERLTEEPLESIASAGGALVPDLQRAPGKKVHQQRISYRTFASADGQRILVGKGAADNDTLTLTIARPHDHWLHVRGVAGSHVVVPLERKATIGQELLLDAAHLAAHFSKQRGEPLIEIAHTPRRFVRKKKGAAAGSVQVDKERVFVLRVEPERLARLLASERAIGPDRALK